VRQVIQASAEMALAEAQSILVAEEIPQHAPWSMCHGTPAPPVYGNSIRPEWAHALVYALRRLCDAPDVETYLAALQGTR
jgi:hypothetical protein